MVRPPGRLIKRADVALGVALGRRRPGRCSWGRAGPATAVAGRQAIECDSTSSPPEGPDESALSILANLRGRPIRVARAWRVAVLRPRRLGRTTTLSGAGRGQGDAPRRRTALARGGHWRRQRPQCQCRCRTARGGAPAEKTQRLAIGRADDLNPGASVCHLIGALT